MLRTISGNATTLQDPQAIAMDGSGNIEVGNAVKQYLDGTGGILTFPGLGNGNIAPTARLSGGNTKNVSASAVAFDSSSERYLAENSSGIEIFSARSTGAAAPIVQMTSVNAAAVALR